MIAREGIEEENKLGAAKTIFNDGVASGNVVGDDPCDLVEGGITYTEAPYEFGDIFDGLLMGFGSENGS
jgi:hypothetical protein